MTYKFSVDGPVFNPCKWLFRAAMISSDNWIVPGYHISNPDFFEIPVDDCEAKSMHEVCNSAQYQKFRNAHLRGDTPSVCKPRDKSDEISNSTAVEITPRNNS